MLTSGCLLGRMPYAATGIAETAVTLIALPRPLFDRLLARRDPFRRYVFELFSARLAELMLLIEEVAFRRLDQRLAALLLARGPAVHTLHQAFADELGSVLRDGQPAARSFRRPAVGPAWPRADRDHRHRRFAAIGQSTEVIRSIKNLCL
ncbi:MAG: Crp/Fnr family transcriptional regulator [Betaproteobacteria bacterium]|nr:MAG: Crp/Fnr family transcriptional regulator [Betaproteobacteria bacterium]